MGRAIAGQAADELLNIAGIEASFVLFPEAGQAYLSARSNSDVNVQVISEMLGGGGNAATAGAQFPGKTPEEVLPLLKNAIDTYFDDEKSEFNFHLHHITWEVTPMKVILQQDVKGQGKRGQLVNVSDGYARNFLFPKNLAVPANADNMNKMIMQDKAKKAQMAAEKAEAQAIAEKLKGVMVKIPAKAGTGGRLFGAVTSKEISEALQAQFDLTIAKSKIVQEEPIKSFGTYQLKCKLGYEIIGTVNVVVTEET